ncbi:PPE domain-containing protein [Nocardia camponoti]|uniref:PPE domain-containing protein n=1 Tax=Nocardia camponoti TaxID=1616106 RepID=A0A917VB34_9NOCA|nr:PPE domain-containing protein [Nocardia camponoti]GGK57501.1 hypothetical protein GCM10011591_32070 [Nocardia camponoti]
MIEPPQPGFTGVVWEAREPQRLAVDLTTGAGAVPMADAAAAWSRLAVALGTAVLDYEQVLRELRQSWQSARSEQVWQRVSLLREWLIETATAAAANAARVQAQAAAYEIAKATMPGATELAAIAELQKAVESVGSVLGAPIKAVAASTDADADAATAVASRVMRGYEAATEPLATPWSHAQAPPIASETALIAEGGGAQPKSGGAVSMPGVAGIGSFALPSLPAPVQTAYRAPVLAQSAAPVATPTPTPVATSAPAGTAPLVPGAMPQGGVHEAPRFPRASLAFEESDQLVAEGEIQAAPAVLGGSERAQSQVSSTTTGSGDAS